MTLERRTLLQVVGLGLISAGTPRTPGTLGACTPTPEPEVPEPEAPPEPERDAHRIAARAVRARVTAHVFMDRVRAHPLAPRIGALSVVSEAFEGTDIEPIRDVNRAFVAAASVTAQHEVVAVAEHALPPERVKQAMGTLVAQSSGRWLEDYPFPAARVLVRKRKTVIMAVTPTLLAVTSPAHARAAARLRKSGGLPEPTGPEAVDLWAENPNSSLKARGAPPVPPTIRNLVAKVVLLDGGDADLAIDGESSDTAQATADAAQLTQDIEKATTVDMGIIKFRAFQPIEFTAEGSMVKARRHMTLSEIDSLISLAAMMMG